MKKLFIFTILIFGIITFGFLKVGIALTTPYAYFEETQKGYLLKGIDINLVKMISKDLNEDIEIYIMDFSELLNRGIKKYDMIIGGIHITEERKKYIKFSIPYLTTGLVVLKLKGNNNELKTYGVKNGATGNKKVLEWIKSGKKINYIVYDTNDECLNAVLNGKVDGAFFDLVNAIYLMKKYPVEIYGEPLTKNDVGIGVKDENLLKKINLLILKYREENLIDY
ncbi:substrate-binding periplasmic protein [Marinitoga aeolica]|uniref:Amino acid ABC transporter substrate-binding protein n=1 Tax=Marinitoga aeolica TaxID=2809031 RepID=A0ABY8PTK7_9BACT|nr:transporter substrate-binding domain-containing protein [Marinitoga aeolica]WGS65962.1 amino acid ABC transporter substrate-binding protein [Marinitoga aeolica]